METRDREEMLRRQSLIGEPFKSREILRVVNSDVVAIESPYVSFFDMLNRFADRRVLVGRNGERKSDLSNTLSSIVTMELLRNNVGFTWDEQT